RLANACQWPPACRDRTAALTAILHSSKRKARLSRRKRIAHDAAQYKRGVGPPMSIKGKAYIAGIYEHPTRLATDISLAQIHAQVAKGALEDAGLTKDDVDGYFCAGDAPGLGPMSMVEYMGLKPRHVDSTDTGGSSYVIHVGHAAE